MFWRLLQFYCSCMNLMARGDLSPPFYCPMLDELWIHFLFAIERRHIFRPDPVMLRSITLSICKLAGIRHERRYLQIKFVLDQRLKPLK